MSPSSKQLLPGQVIRKIKRLGPSRWNLYLSDLITSYEYKAGQIAALPGDLAPNWKGHHVQRFERIVAALRWTQLNGELHKDLEVEDGTRSGHSQDRLF